MYIDYHGIKCKVLEFVTKSSGIWLDIGVGYLVSAECVDIVF